jgi:hypothetical protein
MAMPENPYYKRFLAAFSYLLDRDWKRRQKALAIDVGVSPGFISDIKNKKSIAGDEIQAVFAEKMGYPDFDDFIALGRSLILAEVTESSVSNDKVDNIVTEAGEPLPPPGPISPARPLIVQVNTQTDKEFLNGITDLYQGIPLYESGRLAAGINGIEFDPYETPTSMVLVYKPELQGSSSHKLAAIKVGGDSMEPTIIKGSIVVVYLSDKELAEGRVFAVNTPESGMDIASIKRIKKWKDGFVLMSDNPAYPPDLSPLDWNRLCVGRVVWMWRDIRNI